MEDLMRHMLTPNPYFRPGVGEVLEIVENWGVGGEVRLNRVAREIKEDERLIEAGEF